MAAGVEMATTRATSTTPLLPKSVVRRRGRGGGAATGMKNVATCADPCSTARNYFKKRPLLLRCCRDDTTGRRRPHAVSRTTTSILMLLVAAATLSPQGALALDEITAVNAPANLTAGDAHAVQWEYTTDSLVSGTTGDIHPFQIELRSCTPDADGSCGASCGNAYLSLCSSETADVCMDSDGSYDVVIPEDVAAGTYTFSVTFLGTTGWSSGSSSSGSAGAVTGCSDSFTVEEMGAGAAGVLTATTPTENLEPGDPFTARWDYDDGSAGSFEVNLYSCAEDACANGSCGKFTSALCGDGGCYDPGTGDYDVLIPSSTTPGQFKLQVKKTASTSTATSSDSLPESCTADAFDVVEAGAGATTATTAPPSPAPVAAPVAAPAAAPAAAAPTAAGGTVAPTDAPTPAPVAATTPEPQVTEDSSSTTSTVSGETPGTPPTPVPPRVTCDPTAAVTYSHSVDSSTLMSLITIEHESGDRDGGGCTNFSGLWEWLSTKPADVPEDLLYPADPDTGAADTSDNAEVTGSWLLRSSVDVTNGVMFEVIGTIATGGDCDKLFISSSPLVITFRGAGGHLYFFKTHVTSWVESLGEAHTFLFAEETDGSEARSHITCLSEIKEEGQTCDGVAQKERGECRMDILDSVMANLGYQASESYGISWKVRGLCDDLSNRDTLFESVRVYGDLQDSDISGMWYGHYSYGHLGGVWTNNLMHNNHIYGFDPHDDSDYLTISGNTCYENGNHGIIASKRCDHLLVENNESYDNGGSGLILHITCDDSIVRGNNLYRNVDAGVSLVETSRTVVTGNFMNENKYGIRLLVGSNDNTLSNNEFDSNTQHDILLYLGSVNDSPTVEGNEGINMRNTIEDNSIVSTADFTLDVEDSDETAVTNNFFFGEGAFTFIRSTNTRLSGNTGDPAEATAYVEDSCFTSGSGLTPECT